MSESDDVMDFCLGDAEFEEITDLYYEMVGAEAAAFMEGPAVEQVLDQVEAARALLDLAAQARVDRTPHEMAAAVSLTALRGQRSPPPPYLYPPPTEDLPLPPRGWMAPPAAVSPLPLSPPATARDAADGPSRRGSLVGDEDALREAALRSVRRRRLLAGGSEVVLQRRRGGRRRRQRPEQLAAVDAVPVVAPAVRQVPEARTAQRQVPTSQVSTTVWQRLGERPPPVPAPSQSTLTDEQKIERRRQAMMKPNVRQ
ncbi:Msx2-interacting protein [Frankliniella fusca]|uniref:Msx2-interacting protein n=1 Tax=Frankliniella fusca TaxID=407009 RepID=A0AAE1HXG0_9NEOP|nr:Msx2-interacting protein [Frankliniella fusca]